MADPKRPTLLAIFGAGASFGCLPIEPSGDLAITPPVASGLQPTPFAFVRPPLTQDLVRPDEFAASIVGRYEGALPVVDAVRRRIESRRSSRTVSFEQALAEYERRASVDPQALRHLAAMRFYLRDLLWASSEFMRSPTLGVATNHLALVRDLHTWAMGRRAHVCLTSFNYDFVLEDACREVWAFNRLSLEEYVAHVPMSVLKPHGSVVWRWPLPAQRHRGSLHEADLQAIRRVLDVAPDTGALTTLAISPYSTDAKTSKGRQLTVPALALPLDGKSEFVWPPEQAAHFDAIQGRVSKLLIVGWRAVEEHFLARMGRLAHGAKVVIVTGGPNADSEALDIRDRLWGGVLDNTTKLQYETEGFAAFLRSPLRDWLLAD